MEGNGEGRPVYVVCWGNNPPSSQVLHFSGGRWTRKGLTGRMGGLEDPVGVFGVGDGLAPPFDLDVARCLFEEWWPGEAVHVEFGLWGHVVVKGLKGGRLM